MTQEIKLALKALRQRKNMTQKELANIMNVSFQTISKWENGITLPDISYLPALAKCFDVELEVLLGMKSLEEDELQRYDKGEYWQDRLECTKNWKMMFYNEDYLEFLVKKVWKIEKPVKILDCACGYGYLGLQLLPLLPEGSSYTGVDICEAYLEEGKRLFKDLPYSVKFIKGDIQKYEIQNQYDIVLSQLFLAYLKEPELALEKMKHSVKSGGMLVVMDDNDAMWEEAGFIGTEKGELKKNIPNVKKVWEYSRKRNEMDWRMGTKLPFLFHKLGLEKIDVRMSDRVFIYEGNNPLCKEEQLKKYRNIIAGDDRVIEGYSYFLKRGCSWQEAKKFVEYQEKVQEALEVPSVFVSQASCIYIVWGFKKCR